MGQNLLKLAKTYYNCFCSLFRWSRQLRGHSTAIRRWSRPAWDSTGSSGPTGGARGVQQWSSQGTGHGKCTVSCDKAAQPGEINMHSQLSLEPSSRYCMMSARPCYVDTGIRLKCFLTYNTGKRQRFTETLSQCHIVNQALLIVNLFNNTRQSLLSFILNW